MKTLVAFVALCLAASGTYAWNDARDAEADRRHPEKCNRPVAAGKVSVTQAEVFGAVLFLLAFAVSVLASFALLATVVIYVALTLAVLAPPEARAGARPRRRGRVASCSGPWLARGHDVRVSPWFLIVAGAGSLFMVTGKRSAEAAARSGCGAATGVHSPVTPRRSCATCAAVASRSRSSRTACGRSRSRPQSASRRGSSFDRAVRARPAALRAAARRAEGGRRPKRWCSPTRCWSPSAWCGWCASGSRCTVAVSPPNTVE